jgi:DNA repair protein SbcC/Rad50
MRPERLSLKGFGVFSQSTEIDFSGVELFALTGPLGSGKTTVLDGICFALYGSVPRHGKGSVAPVVTQGLMEATVGLTFSIGEQVYRVARKIRKDPKGKGANTTDASLDLVRPDGGTESLAIGGQVTERTIELLGLDFEQFTTCVLLPQGEFARFLHDKPAGRQDLLTALLDLGVYDRVGQLALTRQRTAEGVIALLDQRLAEIGTITDADLSAAKDRESNLSELLGWLEETLPELTGLDKEARDLAAEVERHDAQLGALRTLEVPEGLEALGAEISGFLAEEAEARAALENARNSSTDLAEQATALPSRTQIEAWIALRTSLHKAQQELDPAVIAASSAAKASKDANAAVAARRLEVSAAADGDRAAHLRRGLKLGDPCPICGQTITEVPEIQDAGTVQNAEAALAKAEKAEQKHRKSHDDAENLVIRLRDRIADHLQQLEGVPELDELAVVLGVVEDHEKQVAALATQIAAHRRVLDRVQEQRKKTVDREAAIKSGLATAWHKVAQTGLEPPPFDPTDAFRSWRELAEWRVDTEPRVLESFEKAAALVDDVGRRRKLVVEGITHRLEGFGITIGVSPRDAVVDALSAARVQRERIESSLEELALRKAERDESARNQKVARQLSLELRADHFKKWLFDEVFSALVTGANRRLVDLTVGQYELVMEGRDFEVIDNLSAGNRRSIKTLSGGETFLVSLAMALALAEQVADTAVGETRLDSLFLDEGFGSLDAESLDVVAGVISELGASGKTVGIVTHVAELAEQMPVRYEIRKSSDGATVSEVRQ